MKKIFIGTVLSAAVLLTACEKEQLIDELETTRQTDFITVQNEETTAAVSAFDTSQTTIVGLAESKAETAETEKTEEAEETTDAAEEESSENEQENAVEDEEYSYSEKYLLEIIGYLQNGSGEYFKETGFAQYDIWDDFTLDDYSYVHRGDDIYDVTLTCSDSTCELFPNGESEWVFAHRNASYFIPAEREEAFNYSESFFYPDYADKNSILYSAYLAAYDFSKCIGAYEADSEWFENFDVSNGEYSAEQYVHWIYHAYNPYITGYDSETGEYNDVTPEEFAAAVKKLYNINITAEQARLMTDETGFMRKNCGHGGSWRYQEFAGYEETENEVKVRIDYYGDELYLYRSIQSEYTFSKNEDGSITLQRVEKLFDRGYDIAAGAI